MKTSASVPINSYATRLRERTLATGTTLCVGIDPVDKRVPGDGPFEDRVLRFYGNLLEGYQKRGFQPAAVKPNSAYFEQAGLKAMEVLRRLCADYRSAGILVVLDAKRGDIATSSAAYANAAFEAFASDAVTASPYMGQDSLSPFQDRARALNQGQGIYVLVRTSNPGSADFQSLKVKHPDLGELPLYRVVLHRLLEWDRGDLGAVVGATAPSEMESIVKAMKAFGKELPMLIPGVSVPGVSGGQGGDITEVLPP